MLLAELLATQAWWPDPQLIITVTLAIPGLIIAYLTYQKTIPPKKEVSYEIISDTPILNAQIPVAGPIEVVFAKSKVNNLRLAIIKIWNSGKLTIRPVDFHQPIEFTFGVQTKVLSSEIMEREPSNLAVSLISDPKSVKLEQLMLNPKNSIRFGVWLEGYGEVQGKTQIDGAEMVKAVLTARLSFGGY